MTFQSFDGIIPGLPFMVDRFEVTNSIRTHFLSHSHWDHYGGIIKELGTYHGRCIIYCSAITKEMLIIQLSDKVKRMKTVDIRVLKLGENRIKFNENEITKEYEELSVICINANHCAGSLMFIFQHERIGTLFFTGDFRFEDMTDLKLPVLTHRFPIKHVVDMTFFHEFFDRFPSRKQTTNKAIKFLSDNINHKKLDRKDYRNMRQIFICADILGVEYVFFEIYKAFGVPIIINKDNVRAKRYAHFKILSNYRRDRDSPGNHFSDCILLNDNEECVFEKNYRDRSFIHLIEKKRVKAMKNFKYPHHSVKPIYLSFSTLWTMNDFINNERITKKLYDFQLINGIYHFSFSSHCSLIELFKFIKKLQNSGYLPRDDTVFQRYKNQLVYKLCRRIDFGKESKYKMHELMVKKDTYLKKDHDRKIKVDIDDFDFSENCVPDEDENDEVDDFQNGVIGSIDFSDYIFDDDGMDEEDSVKSPVYGNNNESKRKKKKKSSARNIRFIEYDENNTDDFSGSNDCYDPGYNDNSGFDLFDDMTGDDDEEEEENKENNLHSNRKRRKKKRKRNSYDFGVSKPFRKKRKM